MHLRSRPRAPFRAWTRSSMRTRSARSDGSTTIRDQDIRRAALQSDDWPISRSSASRASASDQTVRSAKRTCASALLLALLRVGREQVVERRGPFRALDVRRSAPAGRARNTSRSSCERAEQLLGGVADRFEPLEPQRERGRHVLGARPSGAFASGQQQARLQIGEPRRHHQIVGARARAAACAPPR